MTLEEKAQAAFAEWEGTENYLEDDIYDAFMAGYLAGHKEKMEELTHVSNSN